MSHRFPLALGCIAALLPGTAQAIPPSATLATPVTITVAPTALTTVVDVSRTGRFVLGAATEYGRLQLRDLQEGARVVRLPRKAVRASLSDNGRYLAYSMPIGQWGRHQVRVYDRVRDRTVDVTRRSNGTRLVPSWRGRCTEALCDEDQKLVLSPQLIGGQISGNGRYVVFSANFGKPGRIDLYLKNLRTGRLAMFKGVGQPLVAEGDAELVQAPSVSADAAVVLVPGRVDAYESETTWGPGRALFDRTRIVDIGGMGNTMTRNGHLLSINGVFSGSAEMTPGDVAWYDVATAVSVPADPPSLRMNRTNSSADGRYVLWRTTLADPLQIRDRTLAVTYDLQAALTTAGYTPVGTAGSQGGFVWGHADTHSAMSGDGQVAFVDTDHGLVAIRWLP